MPYIVENTDGIFFEEDIFITPTTFNYGTSSDAATSLTCSVYVTNGYWGQYNFLEANSEFYVNRGYIIPTDLITTVSGGVSLVTTINEHVIIASFSSANSNDIWLGTSSRVEGKEFIIKRIDGTSATVTIRSSQTDIDDGISVTGNVSSLTLANNKTYRIVRIGGLWTVMNYL